MARKTSLFFASSHSIYILLLLTIYIIFPAARRLWCSSPPSPPQKIKELPFLDEIILTKMFMYNISPLKCYKIIIVLWTIMFPRHILYFFFIVFNANINCILHTSLLLWTYFPYSNTIKITILIVKEQGLLYYTYSPYISIFPPLYTSWLKFNTVAL